VSSDLFEPTTLRALADFVESPPAEPPAVELPLAPPISERKKARMRLLAAIRDGLLALNVILMAAWFGFDLLSNARGQIVASVWSVLLVASIIVIAVLGGIAHDIYYWRLPIRSARKVLAELAAGEAPIDDLRLLRRGMRSLLPAIVDLAHRERVLRAKIAQLEIEVKQRVYTRTESLERKLGALQLQASKDVLTGLFNRRAFDTELPKIVDACRKSKRELQLLMIDVDHFKVLNDTLGHPAGDELLRSIGQVMKSTIRDRDMAFRYGGDEFVILAQGDFEAAETLADRLKSLVDGLTKHHSRVLARRPKLSIGISSLEKLDDDAPAAMLLAVADQKLYAIKHARPKSEQRVA
jgi:diguanylate cyclase (GGDEF)-like protein